MMLRLLSFMLLMFSVTAKAATSPGSLFTYEGILTDSGGTPITTTQTVTFQVLYGSCILLEETQSIAPGSDGEFSAIIGIGTRVDSTGNTADRIFASSGSVNCSGSSAVSMSGFSTRTLHIKVGSTDLSPDVTIGNIPMAINSQKLGDKGASDFLQVNTSNGATQTNLESVLARTTELTSLLNAYSGNTLSAQTAVTATTAATATNFTGSLAGDVTGTQSATTVEKIRGINVDSTAPTSGQVLKYVSGKWTPSSESVTSAVTSVTGTSGQITVTGSTAPVLSLASVGTAGTYVKVVTDAQGRVTSGSTALTATDIPSLDWTKITSGTPTTLSGYGITDAVKNGGNAPSIQSGTDTAKPTAGTVGRLYVATDTKIIYRDNGSTWDIVSSATGSGGTITSVVAGTGMTGGGSTGAVTLNANVGTTANQIVQLNSSAQLPAVDGSLLTNVTAIGYSGILPVINGGTGASTFTANRMVATNSTGSALTSFYCPITQLISFDASGVPGCSSYTTLGLFINGGNSFSAAASIGTNDSYPFYLKAGGSTVMTITPAGNVGIGTTSPVEKLTIVQADSSSGFSVINSTSTTARAPYIAVKNYSDSTLGYPLMALQNYRGNSTTATPLQSGDYLGKFIFTGSTTTSTAVGAAIVATTTETWTDSTSGTALAFATTSTGSVGISEKMRIDGLGRLGIGTSAPSSPLHISNSSTSGTILQMTSTDTGGRTYGLASTGTTAGAGAFQIIDVTNSKVRMHIATSGAIGFGTTSPNLASASGPGTLTVASQGSSYSDVPGLEFSNPLATVISGTMAGKLTFNAPGNTTTPLSTIQVIAEGSGGTNGFGGKLIMQTKQDNSTTSNMVVVNNLGYVGIGTLSPSYNLHVVGTAGLSTGTAWTNASDARLKDIHGDYEYGLNEVLKLHTVRYNYKKGNALGLPSDHPMTGFIAQEVQKVIPDAVHTRADGYLELNVDPIHWATVNAVQELHDMCKATEAQLATIERRIASIEEDNRSKDARIKKLEEENAILKKDLELIKTKLGL